MRARLVVMMLFLCARAQAQDAAGPAFALERFRPAVDGKGMVTVNASQTLGHLDFSLGLTGSYAYRSLSLRAFGNALDVDHLMSAQLQGAIGFFGGPRWQRRTRGVSLELAISVPIGVMAGARSPTYRDPNPNADRDLRFGGQSIGDVGLALKLRLLNTSMHPLGLALLLGWTFPSGKSEAFLGEGQTVFRPELILDREFGATKRWKLALNLGAAVRASTHRYTDEGARFDVAGLTARGYGETRPAVDERTMLPCTAHAERCWEKNRRVEFVILIQGPER